MAIWGTTTSGDNIGMEYAPCENKRGTQNIRGCQTTAENLGISFRVRDKTENDPVASNAGNVPGPVPLNMEPNVQTGEPWDVGELDDADLVAAEQWEGMDIDDAASKRGALLAEKLHSAKNAIAATQLMHRVPRNDGVPARRDPASASGISNVPYDTYASTTWPTTLTGTVSFPTSQSVSTMTETTFLTHPSTGLVPGNVGASVSPQPTAAPSLECSMHMQVSIIEPLISYF